MNAREMLDKLAYVGMASSNRTEPQEYDAAKERDDKYECDERQSIGGAAYSKVQKQKQMRIELIYVFVASTHMHFGRQQITLFQFDRFVSHRSFG